jgi:prepilin-type N-terminal cleavage/methylation domain-containing protein
MNPKAFTVVELLVVIAIIAIVAALLFPVFAQSKRSAKATATLSRLHQCHIAVELYREGSEEIPRGLPDSQYLEFTRKGELWGKPYDEKVTATRVYDLLLPYVKTPLVFRSARAPSIPKFEIEFGAYYFGFGYDSQRAMLGPGPNYQRETAVLMYEYLDYETPENGNGMLACLYDMGHAKMVSRLDCLTGLRDLALED